MNSSASIVNTVKNPFKEPKISDVKIKCAIIGPSGSGKTYGALEIASGIGGKIAFVDTENGSSILYSDRFKFDHVSFTPPFHTQRFISIIDLAIENKYDVLIIDSISHQWAGEGGILDRKGAVDSRGGNSWTNWYAFTKEHNLFVDKIIHANIHLIATIRTKQDYIIETNEKGKQYPRKVGLAPIQREGFDYEFNTVFEIASDHSAVISKDMTGLFEDGIFRLSKETGEKFKKLILK